MLVERKSPFTGKIHTMDLPITEEQVNSYMGGELIQDAFPNLTPDEREFIKNGITPDEWDEMFCEEELE
jgi:hypothetical protein